MDASRSATNWPGLFGLSDTKEADLGRSVLSPAAYLADLLQLLEDRFAGSSLHERRPDITKQLPLNGEQSFSLVRQLDIVNRVLADRISQLKQTPADEVLASAVHPFLLPFDGEHARLRQLLVLLRTPFRALHESFTREPDVDVLAREQLGLSPMQATVLVTDLSGDAIALAAAYGLAPDETFGSLQLLERLKRATQLDGPSLRDLLFSRLSSSRDPLGGGERDAAGQLFIHHDLAGFAALDPSEQHLTWNGAQEPIPAAWFDRVHRLLCLSRWTGITLGTLDLTLRQLCDYTLARKALRCLAVLVDLRERTGASLEQLCALIGELDGGAALGAGDDPKQAASLFDHVYNADAARVAKRYVPSGSAYVPPAYQGFAPLLASGDVLLDAGFNKDLRARIQSALGISARDLSALITRLRERAVARGRVSRLNSLDSRGLSILYRIARLAELVDLSPLDFLRLLDVLEHDSSLKVQNAFDVLDPQQLAQADLYAVLEQGSVAERSWLVQNVVAVAAWAAAATLLPEDLEAAAIVPDPTLPAQQAELIATSSALREALAATALTAESLTTAEISPRVARLAVATVREPKRGLVSPQDARLVTWDVQAAETAAYATVHALEVVSVDDLAALGLGADLADYLQFLLVRRGVLDADALLRDGSLPPQPAALVLESVDAERVAQIFDLLYDQYLVTTGSGSDAQAASDDLSVLDEAESGPEAWSLGEDAEANAPASDDALDALDALDDEVDEAADADTTSEDLLASATAEEAPADESESSAADQAPPAEPTQVELSLYPADLLSLGFTALEADEQLVRLMFLGVLEPTGIVRDPAWFADVAHRNSIPAQLGLDEFRTEIHALLAELLGRWQRAALQLPQDIWDGLPLTIAEREALEQNLVFNGYIDAQRRIVDKTKLAALTAETFDLTLPLYRHRRAILAALQGVVTTAREQYLYVGVDELRTLTDRIVGIQAHRALASASVLDERGRIRAEVLAQIDSETPPFELGALYSDATQQQLWALLRQVTEESKAFRLTDAALASVDLAGEHVTEVIISLCATGSLQPDRSLSAEQVACLRVVHSIKDFELPAYADYARDVFFLVQDVAVATDAAVTAISTALGGVAAAQQASLLEALGSRIELDAETTHAILRALLHDEAHPSVALAARTARTARVTLAPAGEADASAVPQDRVFCATLGRLRAFASFARKLQMTPRQIEAAFGDQQLVEKFPEALVLPAGVDAIDAMWTAPNGKIHLFRGAQYWVFDAATRFVLEQARPLAALSPSFKGLTAVDAVYALPNGEHWLLAGGRAFRRTTQAEHWLEVSRVWGRVQSRFEAPARIECALHDHEGRLHLFCGDQYVRYSSTPQAFVDEGYPRKIAPHWAQELGFGQLPQDFSEGVDAALSRNDEVTWLFKGERFVASHDLSVAHDIVDTWGHVRNNLASASRVDAVFDWGGRCAIVVGDQLAVFSSGLENEETSADAGYPRTLAVALAGLPDELAHGFDAGLRDEDGTLHLFHDQTCATRGEAWSSAPTRERWGRVHNQL